MGVHMQVWAVWAWMVLGEHLGSLRVLLDLDSQELVL